jgi:hypothetical protein
VTITVTDTTPPQVSAFTFPITLWPPNHRLVSVNTSVPATDVCGPVSVILSSITSSEPDNGTGIGDGNTIGDIRDAELGAEDLQVRLRAERAGTGNGRVYTLEYTAMDMSSNQASATAVVVVPHNQNGVMEPVIMSLWEKANGTTLEWSDVDGALFYNVIRGDLESVREIEAGIDLGAVSCVKAASVDSHTVGWEDDAVPGPGGAFFYLVEYFDGWNTSFGTASAAKERTPLSGSCE